MWQGVFDNAARTRTVSKTSRKREEEIEIERDEDEEEERDQTAKREEKRRDRLLLASQRAEGEQRCTAYETLGVQRLQSTFFFPFLFRFCLSLSLSSDPRFFRRTVRGGEGRG